MNRIARSMHMSARALQRSRLPEVHVDNVIEIPKVAGPKEKKTIVPLEAHNDVPQDEPFFANFRPSLYTVSDASTYPGSGPQFQGPGKHVNPDVWDAETGTEPIEPRALTAEESTGVLKLGGLLAGLLGFSYIVN